jgi:hypothetical protein
MSCTTGINYLIDTQPCMQLAVAAHQIRHLPC